MKSARLIFAACFSCLLLASCSGSNDILKALNIDYTSAREQKMADQETIDKLKKRLAGAEKNEARLNKQIVALEEKLSQQETGFSEQISELKKEFDLQQSMLSEQVEELRNEIREKESIITIQGKVIGLLDDADHTLQKSINAQIKQSTY
jgi:predicted  nucleic acid-binding Zn-ribbon protein